ncbi:MAG TPA: hypothetical protein VKI40_04020 [Terriglobales bacterium]|nr:hypothetical protein [Terriglobales bacterium]
MKLKKQPSIEELRAAGKLIGNILANARADGDRAEFEEMMERLNVMIANLDAD